MRNMLDGMNSGIKGGWQISDLKDTVIESNQVEQKEKNYAKWEQTKGT